MAQRKLLVRVRVLNSVGRLSQALGLFALATYGIGSSGTSRTITFEMTNMIDTDVLQFMVTTSTYTEFTLSAPTSWDISDTGGFCSNSSSPLPSPTSGSSS